MSGLFAALARGFEKKSGGSRILTSRDLLDLLTTGGTSSAGPSVNWKSALAVTTVLACTKVIGDGLSQVPWKLHRKDERGRSEAVDHPLADVISRRPNEWQTSFELRETMALHVVLTGNAFAYLNRSRTGELLEILPYEPGFVSVKQERDLSLSYEFRMADGARVTVPRENVWHLRGPSWSGWLGLDATRLARDAIGLSMAIETGQARAHRDGLKQSGTYSVEGPLDIDQHTKLMDWLNKWTAENAGKPLVLDRGAKWLATQMSGVDAQTIETRKHQVEEICRAFRVMPIMVGQADKAATYASAEQMFIAHVVHTLLPWYERWQQSADVNLLTKDERRQGFYTKLNPAALLRGAAKDRGEYFAKALGAGGQKPWMTADEVRALEELNPIGGHAGELGEGAMHPAGGGTTEDDDAG
jgi:HK97 family phage portal protein